MVIAYRNKFIKVFAASLIVFGLVLIVFVWGLNTAYEITGGNSDNPIGLIRLTYTLIAILIMVGETLYIYSHYLLAKAKGYSGWLALLGLLSSFIGLAIIFLLPDKRKENSTPPVAI